MALHPITRRSVPEEVFGQIAANVLSGELQPGEALPSERRLAELLEVSRPAVREALKHLSATGLIEVRQGGLTTVCDFRRHAGPELLPQLLFRDGKIDTVVAASLLEARLRNGPEVAELAAERHGPELAEPLAESVRALDAEQDPVEWQRHTLAFWDLLVDGSASIVFRLMYNTFHTAYEPVLPLLSPEIAAEPDRTEIYRALADAVTTGDRLAAKQTARELIESGNAALIAVLEKRDAER